MRVVGANMSVDLDQHDRISAISSITECVVSLDDLTVRMPEKHAIELLRELIGTYPNEAHSLLAEYDDQVATLVEYDRRLEREREGVAVR